MREGFAQMIIEPGLVQKHVKGVVKNVDAVNYLKKLASPTHENCYEEDTYALNDQTGVFRPNVLGFNLNNYLQGQGNKGQNYVITTEKANMSGMGATPL